MSIFTSAVCTNCNDGVMGVTLLAELRLDSEIIGNFRNFEKFLGPLVEHQK